ncbi:uncharacterized protein [Coffea arabica]|uniref:Uncharacterized protein isoform X3 n=1 Tax=Coffea arabica TaxID=13443 RepID=A0ABM4WKD2_COFAR
MPLLSPNFSLCFFLTILLCFSSYYARSIDPRSLAVSGLQWSPLYYFYLFFFLLPVKCMIHCELPLRRFSSPRPPLLRSLKPRTTNNNHHRHFAFYTRNFLVLLLCYVLLHCQFLLRVSHSSFACSGHLFSWQVLAFFYWQR